MNARKKRPELHFGYSTNVHKSETLKQMYRFLEDYTIPVRKRVFGKEGRSGLELRIGIELAKELTPMQVREQFSSYLVENGLDIFSINAFPLNNFQAKKVKEQVYAPDWTTKERVHWTIEISKIFADLLPEDRQGSVSSLTGTYRPWKDTPKVHRAIAEGFLKVLWAQETLYQKTGKDVVLAIEPEPDTTLDTSDQVIDFFENTLLPLAKKKWKNKFSTLSQLEQVLRHRFTVNLDTCHFSVLFDEPAQAAIDLAKAGIKIGKVHVTNALALRNPHRSPTGYQTFRGMHEQRYLHQFCGADAQGKPIWRGRDLNELPKQLKPDQFPDLAELRTHFHVPLYLKRWKNLRTTQEDTHKALREIVKRKLSTHLAFETYTWPVLTDSSRLLNGLTREFRWMLNALDGLI